MLPNSPLKGDIPFCIPSAMLLESQLLPQPYQQIEYISSLWNFCQLFFNVELICISLILCQVEHHTLGTLHSFSHVLCIYQAHYSLGLLVFQFSVFKNLILLGIWTLYLYSFQVCGSSCYLSFTLPGILFAMQKFFTSCHQMCQSYTLWLPDLDS